MPLDLSTVTTLDSKMRVLLYSEAGGGKTTLLKGFPKPMLVFDFDNKYKPLLGTPGIFLESYYPKSAEDCKEVFTRFRRDLRAAKSDPKWATICLDSLTSLDTLALKYFCLMSGKSSEDAPTLPVYGDLNNYYAFLFTELKSVDKWIVVTAHEFFNTDEDSGLVTIQPLITGRTILGKLPAFFEEVWYLERKGGTKDEPVRRVLHYMKWKKCIATSASLKGNGELVDPTFDKIKALL